MTGRNNTETTLSNTGMRLAIILLKIIAHLPFGAIYILSDIFYLIIKNIVKYRSNVITDNLRHAFPKKDDNEIIKLRNKYYRHLCDVSLEAIKQYGMSPKEIDKRMVFKGTEAVNDYAARYNGAIILSFHYNNWEWTGALQKSLNHKLLMVYNKMRNNKSMDNFLLQARNKWGGEAVQMGRAPKVFFQYKEKGISTVLGLIADQSALKSSQSWITFLNREAAFFSGPERIARHTNFPIFFAHTKRIKRGHYECSLSLLHIEPSSTNDNDILKSYVKKMEETIRKQPEYYLWSHKRWKHKRPQNIELIQ